jgi:hypothetical protein
MICLQTLDGSRRRVIENLQAAIGCRRFSIMRAIGELVNLEAEAFTLKSVVDPIQPPFVLSLSKGGRGLDRLTQWVGVWKLLMVRLAYPERFSDASTDFFRFTDSRNTLTCLLRYQHVRAKRDFDYFL